MIRAVIFDCFGVLTTDGWLPYKQRMFGGDRKKFAEAVELNRQADGGLISYEQFVGGVAELAQQTPAQVTAAIEDNVANEQLFAYITQELKGKYKLGILSNAASNWLSELFVPEQLALFDVTVLSYESGVAKPNERAYLAVADRLGVTPEECIFVDDQERYCTAAEQAGMRALVYRDMASFTTELAVLLHDTKN